MKRLLTILLFLPFLVKAQEPFNTPIKYLKNFGSGLTSRSVPDKGYIDSIAAILSGMIESIESGTTASFGNFDIIMTGQSNANGSDVDLGTWTYTVDPKIFALQLDGTLEVANPAEENIATDFLFGPRNNIGWAFAREVSKRLNYDSIRLIVSARGSEASYRWTPKTTGEGELNTSNRMLDSLVNKLNRAPSTFRAKVILVHQLESNDADGISSSLLNHWIEVYDSLVKHPKVDPHAVMLLGSAINGITYDSVNRAIDSLNVGIRATYGRPIYAVKLNTVYGDTLQTFDNNHLTNEQMDRAGAAYFAKYMAPTIPEDAGFHRVGASILNDHTNTFIGSATSTKRTSYFFGLQKSIASNSSIGIDGSGNGMYIEGKDLSDGAAFNLRTFATSGIQFTLSKGSIGYGAGIKQTFSPNGTNAGFNFGSHTADPSSLVNGDAWYNSTSNQLKARINGSTVVLGAAGSGFGDATMTSAVAITGGGYAIGWAGVSANIFNDGTTNRIGYTSASSYINSQNNASSVEVDDTRTTINGSLRISNLSGNGNGIVSIDNNGDPSVTKLAWQSISDGATLTFDASAYINATTTLGGNRTLAFSNLSSAVGKVLTYEFIQDGTGGRTLTLPSICYVVNGGGGAISLSTTPGARDVLQFLVRSTSVVYVTYGPNFTD